MIFDVIRVTVEHADGTKVVYEGAGAAEGAAEALASGRNIPHPLPLAPPAAPVPWLPHSPWITHSLSRSDS